MQEIGYKPRVLEYRAKQAVRLLGNVQGAPITGVQLRTEAGDVKQSKQGVTYHNVYDPMDIRRVREKLDPQLMDNISKRIGGFPPIICGHVTKGGTGKTSATTNIAVALAAQGYKVLLIDGDPQGSATETLGVDSNHENLKTLRDLLIPNKDGEYLTNPDDVIISIYDNAHLHLVPGDNLLTRLEREINNERFREKLFWNLVHKVFPDFFKRYDFVLIDTAPSSSSLNFNLLVSASIVLGIVSLDGSSLKALKTLKNDIDDVEAIIGSAPPFMLLPNKFHSGEKHCFSNLDFLRTNHPAHICEHVIPVYTGFARQVKIWDVEKSRPLFEEDPTCPASEVLLDISRVLIKRLIEEPAAVARQLLVQQQNAAQPA